MAQEHPALMRTFTYILLLLVTATYPAGFDVSTVMTPTERKLVEAGETITHQRPSPEGRGLTYEVLGEVLTTKEHLLRVLMDYENYPEFMSTVSKVSIVSQTEAGTTLNFFLALPFGLEKKYRTVIQLVESDSLSARLEWKQVEWPGLSPKETLRDTQGYWLIHEMGPSRLFLIYHVFSDPGSIPFGLSWALEPISKSNVTGVFRATRSWAETTSLDR